MGEEYGGLRVAAGPWRREAARSRPEPGSGRNVSRGRAVLGSGHIGAGRARPLSDPPREWRCARSASAYAGRSASAHECSPMTKTCFSRSSRTSTRSDFYHATAEHAATLGPGWRGPSRGLGGRPRGSLFPWRPGSESPVRSARGRLAPAPLRAPTPVRAVGDAARGPRRPGARGEARVSGSGRRRRPPGVPRRAPGVVVVVRVPRRSPRGPRRPKRPETAGRPTPPVRRARPSEASPSDLSYTSYLFPVPAGRGAAERRGGRRRRYGPGRPRGGGALIYAAPPSRVIRGPARRSGAPN